MAAMRSLLKGTPENKAFFGVTRNDPNTTAVQKQRRTAFGYTGPGLYGGQGGYSLSQVARQAWKYGRPMLHAALSTGPTAGLYNEASNLYKKSGAKWLGSGGYEANTLMMDGAQKETGLLIDSGDEADTIVISDTEFVKDIFAPTFSSASSGFAQQQLEVNPGLPDFAPNLSQLAANYGEYTLLQLVYELRPVISENNVNNGQSGIVMMAFNYNPNDDPFDNKEDIMQAHGGVSGRITDKIVCGVECDPSKTNKTSFFVRTQPFPHGKDADEYDPGRLSICTNNIPLAFQSTQICELWVSYTVQLRKRKAGAIRLINQQRDLFANMTQSNFALGALFTPTNMLENLKAQSSNLGCGLAAGIDSAAQLRLLFPAAFNGIVEVELRVEGSLMASGSVSSSILANSQISRIADMFSAGAAGDVPASEITNLTGDLFVYKTHLRVRSAVGGADNAIQFQVSASTGIASSWTLEVKEYFAMPQSRAVVAPMLINMATGVVVTPA
jgi:hypothetical protein